MELKIKYQYTYFIYPFFIKENKYDNYLLKLLKNSNCKLKVFEKEKDLNIYSYFIPNVRKYFFPSFDFTKQKIKELENMDNSLKSAILSKIPCSIFEYSLPKDIQGKAFTEDSIFFKISKIEIICFKTGICFIALKTTLENSELFSNILNFNYKFKELNTKGLSLKEYDNIKIQADTFSNIKELSIFLQELTDNGKFQDKKELNNQYFFTYSYVCTDDDVWKSEDQFSNIENEFLKLNYSYPSNYNFDFNEMKKSNLQTISNFKYIRFGFTKTSSTLFVSNKNIGNYAQLPFSYENEYLYTLIFNLYQKIFLDKTLSDLKELKNIDKIREGFTDFTNNIWLQEITINEIGVSIFKKLKKTFELEEVYKKIKEKYDIMYKNSNIEKSVNTNKIIIIVLCISLIFNIINIFILAK